MTADGSYYGFFTALPSPAAWFTTKERPRHSDFVTGKQGLQTFWQALIDIGSKEAKLEIVEVEGHGDTAIEVS